MSLKKIRASYRHAKSLLEQLELPDDQPLTRRQRRVDDDARTFYLFLRNVPKESEDSCIVAGTYLLLQAYQAYATITKHPHKEYLRELTQKIDDQFSGKDDREIVR